MFVLRDQKFVIRHVKFITWYIVKMKIFIIIIVTKFSSLSTGTGTRYPVPGIRDLNWDRNQWIDDDDSGSS